MDLDRLEIMYGHLEGVRFARDPAGLLAVEAGIFREHGLEVSWRRVQGTEERYRRLQSAAADLSFVVGRASLKHFLDSGMTRLIGSSMNSCPYVLVVHGAIRGMDGLRGTSLACRESTARGARLARALENAAGLKIGADVALELPEGDQDAFRMLVDGDVQGALLPRPYGCIAEEGGFKRLREWPDVVDDPLPVTIETTAELLTGKEKTFVKFLAAYRAGIRYLKTHRDATMRLLGVRFGQPPSLAARIFDDYLVCLDDRLAVDFAQVEKLLAQLAPGAGGARKVASEWIVAGAVRS